MYARPHAPAMTTNRDVEPGFVPLPEGASRGITTTTDRKLLYDEPVTLKPRGSDEEPEQVSNPQSNRSSYYTKNIAHIRERIAQVPEDLAALDQHEARNGLRLGDELRLTVLRNTDRAALIGDGLDTHLGDEDEPFPEPFERADEFVDRTPIDIVENDIKTGEYDAHLDEIETAERRRGEQQTRGARKGVLDEIEKRRSLDRILGNTDEDLSQFVEAALIAARERGGASDELLNVLADGIKQLPESDRRAVINRLI